MALVSDQSLFYVLQSNSRSHPWLLCQYVKFAATSIVVESIQFYTNLKYRYRIIRIAIKLYCVLFFVLSWALDGESQTGKRKFRQLGIYNGLSQNMVSSIVQDHNGFMWFGTKDGLNRFDGYSYKIYKSSAYDKTSIGDNHITCLYEDDNNNLWVSTRQGGLDLYDPESDSFIKIQNGQLNGKSIIINSITGNMKVGLWLSTLDGLIFGLDVKLKKPGVKPDVRIIELSSSGPTGNIKIQQIFLDHTGLLWITSTSGVRLYDFRTGRFIDGISYPTFKVFEKSGSVPHTRYDHFSPFSKMIYRVTEDDEGNVWLTSEEGLYKFDRRHQVFSFYELGDYVTTITIVKNRNGENEIWAGSYQKGLMILNTRTGKFEVIEYDKFANLGVLNGLITKIYKGSDGTVWIGTNGRGVVYYSPNNSLFENRLPQRLIDKYPKSPSIYSILPVRSKGKNILILNTLEYFYCEDLTTGRSFYDTLFYSRVSYEDDKGGLWLGTTEGLARYDYVSKEMTILVPGDKIVSGIHIEKDKVWYSTPNLLKLYNTKNKTIRSFKLGGREDKSSIEPHETLFSTIHPDADGTLWIGAVNGLFHFDPEKEQFIGIYKNDPANNESISSNEIKSILQDPSRPYETLWIGTTAGLNKLDKKRGTFVHFSTKDGLPNNTIYGILPDKEGNLWLSTNHGLAVFNTKEESFINFDVHNGLQSNEFNTGASFKSKDGEMFFGGISGYNSFYPEEIKLPRVRIPIVISDIALTGSDSRHHFSMVNENKLAYDNNNIIITLASLDYSSSEKLRYAYRIFNQDTSWISLGNNRTITLGNLSPGKYVFQAKGTDSFGRWGENVVEMVFIISPPWWNSIWANLFYVVFCGGVLYLLWRRNKSRLMEKHQLEDERRQAAAILELDKTKSMFIANITHEFRTPLTMILGLTDDHSQEGGLTEDMEKKKNDVIKRNGMQLLGLVDQMLELSKLESGKHTVDLQAGDLSAFIAHIVYSFESLAHSKHIRITNRTGFRDRVFLFDFVKIQQVLSNLISNAVKFSDDHTEVRVTASLVDHSGVRSLSVHVADTGIGIPEEELSKVFDRFHRVRVNESRQIPGTGIGLALAKELVELMGGTIAVSSEMNKGSVFSFEIPVSETDANAIGKPEDLVPVIDAESNESAHELSGAASEPEVTGNSAAADMPLILIVEDNEDVREYIYSCLLHKFKVITAVNGREGLEMAVESIPDIIISDVMMPEKDGFTLCDEIKGNPVTSHIPVILLTAKVDSGSKIEGLRKGADAYLTKPFNRVELLLVLDNMIALIQRMQIRHIEKIKNDQPGNAEAESTPEDAFIVQVLSILEMHYPEENFSIEDMADQVFMSRSQLFRKIKALTGHSPSTFLRSFRLKKAKELLRDQPDLNISEVAYATGFNSPKYFSNVFLEEFGHRPRQVQ